MAAGPAPAGKLRTGGHRPAALHSHCGALFFDRVIAPDGSEIAPISKPQPNGTLLKALARPWRWQTMLDEGGCATVSEIGDAEKISKSYLAARVGQSLVLERLERPPPVRNRAGGRSAA
jgi:hypothetical protein